MNAHTQQDDSEMTTEEYAEKTKYLRIKKRELLADPITKENTISLVHLLAEYIELGSHHNENDLHKRIGDRRAVLSGLSIASPAPVTEKAVAVGQML